MVITMYVDAGAGSVIFDDEKCSVCIGPAVCCGYCQCHHDEYYETEKPESPFDGDYEVGI